MEEFTLEELLDPAWVAPGDPEDHFRPGRGTHLVKLFSAGAPLWRECLRVAHLTTDQPASGAGEEGGVRTVGEAGALFAFMGWLTSREAISGPFSARHEASQAAELVKEFRLSQGWGEPADGWVKLLKPYPGDIQPASEAGEEGEG